MLKIIMYLRVIMFTTFDQKEVVIIGIHIEKKLMFLILYVEQIKNKII